MLVGLRASRVHDSLFELTLFLRYGTQVYLHTVSIPPSNFGPRSVFYSVTSDSVMSPRFLSPRGVKSMKKGKMIITRPCQFCIFHNRLILSLTMIHHLVPSYLFDCVADSALDVIHSSWPTCLMIVIRKRCRDDLSCPVLSCPALHCTDDSVVSLCGVRFHPDRLGTRRLAAASSPYILDT